MAPSAASLKAIRERNTLPPLLADSPERIVLLRESERDNLFDVIDALAGLVREQPCECLIGYPTVTDVPFRCRRCAALALVESGT